MISATIQLIFLLLLLLLNGLFAMSEMAIVSARRARLQQMADEGRTGAWIALELAESPSHFLATVQIGITLIGVFAGAFGGATLGSELTPWFKQLPFVGSYADTISIGLVVLCITFLSLVVGELAPKRLALARAESIACWVAPTMRILSTIASPVVYALSSSTELVLRLLGIQFNSGPDITEDEVKLMLEQGAEVGIFDPIEEEMLQQVFLVGDLTIKALMTPYTEIIWLNVDSPLAEIHKQIISSKHTRFPVARSSLENILGVVLVKDLLAQILSGQSLDLEAVVHPALYIPATIPTLSALEYLQENHTQIAFVIGEYGNVQGLITIQDILEAIVGDMPETHTEVEIEIVEREDGSWLIDGRLPIYEFKEYFQIQALPHEEASHYQTLGGFVMTYMERVPSKGDYFEWHGLRFEVVDMDGRRVDQVLLSKQP